MNRFEAFFNDFKSLIIKLKLPFKELHLKGCTQEEIDAFEEECQIVFDKSLRAFFSILGSRFGSYCFPTSTPISLGGIKAAIEEDKELNISSTISRIGMTEYERPNPFYQNAEKTIPLYFYDQGDNITFIEEGIENPKLYVGWENGKVTGATYTITTLFREMFFDGLRVFFSSHKHYFDDDEIKNRLKNETYVESIPWLAFYSEYPNNIISENVDIWREEFATMIINKEEQEQLLFGIDEYEVEFIKFMIEKKGIAYDPKVFDPYAQLMTFETYLTKR